MDGRRGLWDGKGLIYFTTTSLFMAHASGAGLKCYRPPEEHQHNKSIALPGEQQRGPDKCTHHVFLVERGGEQVTAS